jgi:hypothetical protein
MRWYRSFRAVGPIWLTKPTLCGYTRPLSGECNFQNYVAEFQHYVSPILVKAAFEGFP